MVEVLEFEGPEIDWCPWCGEPDTDGEFCDYRCAREYHVDVRSETEGTAA
jgi:hypothetical protein